MTFVTFEFFRFYLSAMPSLPPATLSELRPSFFPATLLGAIESKLGPAKEYVMEFRKQTLKVTLDNKLLLPSRS
jgi:hypothetical protein